MDKDRWEGGKGSTIRERERRGHEQAGVCLVLHGVEDTISQDGRDVVVVSGVIEGIEGRDGEICRVPCVGDCNDVNDASNARSGTVAHNR